MLFNIQISIPSFYLSEEDERTIYYQIHVMTTKRNWVLEKRYSQFKDLRKQLKEYFPDALPPIPQRKYTTFFVGKSHEEIEERRTGLEEFLKQIIQHEQILKSASLQQFLETATPSLDEHQFHSFIHGIRDFHYDGQKLYIVNAEMNPLSRVDAYFQNMKLPWEAEKGDQTMRPVGCLECWEDEKRCWIKTYNSQAICLFIQGDEAFIGLDSGSINYLHLTHNKFDSSYEIEQHSDRVMGIFYHQDLLHSVGKDQNYRVLNLRKEELIFEYEHTQELTCIKYCTVRECAFIGDRAGCIYIFSKFQLVAELNTKLQFIRDLTIDNKRNYLLAVGYQQGNVVVFDINRPGLENQLKEVTSFKSKDKSRCIQWSPSRGEVFIGNDEGVLTIWSAKDCSPIKEFKLHNEAITRMIWTEELHRLITGSKDKSIKIIFMPKSWTETSKINNNNNSNIVQDLDNWYK